MRQAEKLEIKEGEQVVSRGYYLSESLVITSYKFIHNQQSRTYFWHICY